MSDAEVTTPAWWRRPWVIDWTITLLLVVIYTGALLNSVHNLGYARDEGFYFEAADTYRHWFATLLDAPGNAFKQATVDRYWRTNHEHPALIKSLFALSRALLADAVHLFREPGTSYRFVGMALTSGAVGVIYNWGRRAFVLTAGMVVGRIAAVVAALSFALMPQIFFHAHLACFDMPIVAMWVFTSYAYWRSLEGGWRKAVVCGLLYGLMLNTKHNSWLLPFPLVAHCFWFRGAALLVELRKWRLLAALKLIPAALWAMLLIGPLVFFATWPWIWFDTFRRLAEYVHFHTQHVYYNIEFLGETYFEPPFPRSYAPLMTLATVPAVTLCLAAWGTGRAILAELRAKADWLGALRRDGFWRSLEPELQATESAAPPLSSAPARSERSTAGLWLLFILSSYAPWFSNASPIFGGTKHWTTAYPFIALLAGSAFVALCTAARATFVEGVESVAQRALPFALCACVLISPLVITWHSHPWGLSTYTPIVGGAPGAATLGLNRSFWGYTTGAIQDEINEQSPRGAKVFVHDTALQSWQMLVKDGRVRSDLRPQLGVATSKIAIYHHEQHMSRVEHQIWVDYGSVKPVDVGTFDGVPVIWLYKRP
ncbi:MAG TPA: glycosyltransferase family 39 protein [Polyangiaceae bacterium]|nr:glycosyltransferase family 39 protein [Polyangiaceae bacterium]